jgi:LL-H family phage holin
MLTKLLTDILFAVMIAAIGIVGRILVPYLMKKEEELTYRLRQTEWAWAADIVDTIVMSVEQTLSEDLHGYEKKKVALDKVSSIFAGKGIRLSDEQIDALIEAAVHAMNADRSYELCRAIGFTIEGGEEGGGQA